MANSKPPLLRKIWYEKWHDEVFQGRFLKMAAITLSSFKRPQLQKIFLVNMVLNVHTHTHNSTSSLHLNTKIISRSAVFKCTHIWKYQKMRLKADFVGEGHKCYSSVVSPLPYLYRWPHHHHHILCTYCMSSIMLFPVRGHEKAQQTRTHRVNSRPNYDTSTTTKPRVVYGNSHLKCV